MFYFYVIFKCSLQCVCISSFSFIDIFDLIKIKRIELKRLAIFKYFKIRNAFFSSRQIFCYGFY